LTGIRKFADDVPMPSRSVARLKSISHHLSWRFRKPRQRQHRSDAPLVRI